MCPGRFCVAEKHVAVPKNKKNIWTCQCTSYPLIVCVFLRIFLYSIKTTFNLQLRCLHLLCFSLDAKSFKGLKKKGLKENLFLLN